MEDNLADSGHSAYHYKHMHQKLKEHFGERIILTEINGKPNVVTFRNRAKAVLHNFYSQQRGDDPDTEKIRIVETASKLIRDDIKAVETSHKCNIYPACDELRHDECMNYLPSTLRALLEGALWERDPREKLLPLGKQ